MFTYNKNLLPFRAGSRSTSVSQQTLACLFDCYIQDIMCATSPAAANHYGLGNQWLVKYVWILEKSQRGLNGDSTWWFKEMINKGRRWYSPSDILGRRRWKIDLRKRRGQKRVSSDLFKASGIMYPRTLTLTLKWFIGSHRATSFLNTLKVKFLGSI